MYFCCRSCMAFIDGRRYSKNKIKHYYLHTDCSPIKEVHIKERMSLKHIGICKISARIPHQSQIGSEDPICDSFSPGEALGAAVPMT